MLLIRPRVRTPDKVQKQGRIPVSEDDADSGLKAILEWIPIEIVGPYKAIANMIPSGGDGRLWLTLIGLPVTFCWIALSTKGDRRVAWRQAIVSTWAFAFWAAGLQPDVMKLIFPGWQDWMSSVALAGGSLILGLIDRILAFIGVPQN